MPTFADEYIETTFFGNLKDDGEGCGIYTVLDLVLQILGGGVGIAAIIGISYAGVMYLTAGSNESQVTKAKSRLFNIVLGVVAFAAIYASLVFLIPNFNPKLSSCSKASDKEVADYKAKQEAEKQSSTTPNTPSSDYKQDSGSGSTSGSGSGAKPNSSSSSDSTKSKAERSAEKRKEINQVALKLASGTDGRQPTSAFQEAFRASGVEAYENSDAFAKRDADVSAAHKKGKSCGPFAATVLVTSGVLDIATVRKNHLVYAATFKDYFQSSKNWQLLPFGTKPQPGDVGLWEHSSPSYTGWHIRVYVQSKNGKVRAAEGSLGQYYGHITDDLRYTHLYRYIGG